LGEKETIIYNKRQKAVIVAIIIKNEAIKVYFLKYYPGGGGEDKSTPNFT